MRLLKIILILLAGIASVVAAQAFYRKFYNKWKYYTLFDDETY